MMKIGKVLAKLLALLIISGMVLHGLVPHHHHEVAGEVQTCCESHHHQQGESHSDDEAPCTILSNIHFENLKPQLKVFAQELKHNHFDDFIAICPLSHLEEQHPTHTKTPVFITKAIFSESGFYYSFSHRGPPLA
jgi:hypothetical protein